MVVIHNGLICGKEFAPKLDTFENSKRLTLYVVMTRGGNKKRNWDKFEIKVVQQNLIDSYYEKLANDKMQGCTCRLQLSIEMNEKTNQPEFIASYIQFDCGEEILLHDCPEYARKPVEKPHNVIPVVKEDVDVEKVSETKNEIVEEPIETKKQDEENISNDDSIHVTMIVDEETIEDGDTVVEDSFVEDISLCQAPIRVVENARKIILAGRLKVVKATVNGSLADNDDYLAFRDLMG
jgi:hypothetical protein